MEDFRNCDNCEVEISFRGMYDTPNGDEFCHVCAYDMLTQCDNCSEYAHNDEVSYSETHGEHICDSCVDDGDYIITDCCLDIVHRFDVVSPEDDEEYYYCDIGCAIDSGCFICEDCDEVYTEDSIIRINSYGEAFCENCGHNEYIREYGDNPPVEFYGNADNNRYYGVELELDNGDSVGFAEDYNEEVEERIFLMEDGSLSPEGVEVISQPMSLEEHLDGGLWEDVRSNALNNGLRSHDTSTCGLHIHVSRAGLHDEDAIDNVIFIVNRFWNKMRRFSRRDISELREWANKSVNKEDEDVTIEDVKNSDKMFRFNAINLQNSQTIEFRLFKGSIRVKTLHSSLQLVDMIVRVANMYSENEVNINNLEWSFLTGLAFDDYRLLYNELVRLELV